MGNTVIIFGGLYQEPEFLLINGKEWMLGNASHTTLYSPNANLLSYYHHPLALI